jgi:hypothetical protein
LENIPNYKDILMDKGLIVILAAGAAFIYFAMSLFNTSSSTDDSQWTDASSSKSTYSRYYKQDSVGDKVLDLNSIDTDEATKIWATAPVEQKVSDAIPDFDLAKDQASNALTDGTFKKRVLNYIHKLQNRYITGEIDADQAKKLIKKLK